MITMCDIYDVCGAWLEDWEELCPEDDCTTSCPSWDHEETDCFAFWVEDGWTATGGAPPYIPWSGGGGGGPWWNNTCSQAATTCGTVGWSVVDPNDEFIINYFDQGYRHFDFNSVIRADRDAINNWKQNKLDTSGLDPCIREILNKLLTSDNLLGKMLVDLDRATFNDVHLSGYSLKFIVDSSGVHPGAAASAHSGNYDPITDMITDTVFIHPARLAQSTELFMTQAIIHEIAHSYIKFLAYVYYVNMTALQIRGLSVDSTFSIYVDSLVSIHTRKGVISW